MWDEPQELLAKLLEDLGSPRPHDAAIALLRRFGSVPSILAASRWSLRYVLGWRLALALKNVDTGVRDELLGSLAARPTLTNLQALRCFLRECELAAPADACIAIHVDSDLKFIRVRNLQRHSTPGGIIDVSTAAAEALRIGAFGFFLARLGGFGKPDATSGPAIRCLDGFHGERSFPLIAQVLVTDGEVQFFPTLSSPRAGVTPSGPLQIFQTPL